MPISPDRFARVVDHVREHPDGDLSAVAPARGDLARVARVWHHLYHRWLPASRHEPCDLPPFERSRGWPDTLDPEAWDLDCCIPLKALVPE